MKIHSIIFLCLITAFASLACHAQDNAELDLPALIQMDGAPLTLEGTPFALEGDALTLEQAVITGIERNRTIAASKIDYFSAIKKVSETKAQFGFNLKMEGNYQKVEDSTSFGLPIVTYAPVGYTDSDPANPPINFTTMTPYANPQLVSGATPTVTMQSAALNQEWQSSADLSLTKPLLTFGVRRDSIRAMKRQRDVKELDIEIARLDTIYDIKESFYQLVLAYQSVNTLLEAVSQAEAHLAAANARFKSGVSPRLDVIRAEGDVEQSREDLIRALKYFEMARMSLNNRLGFPVDRNTWIDPKNAFREVDLKMLDEYYEFALATRQELEQIELSQELARISARLNKNKPMVSLAGTWNFHARGSSFASEHSWRGVLAAEIPIFDNGLAKAKVSQARQLEEKLKINEIDLREGIKLQVKEAYLSVIEAEQRVETSSSIVEMAEEAYRMADIGFREGVTAQIDLLDAENGVIMARLNKLNANYDYEMAKARLARACGLGFLDEHDKAMIEPAGE